jgi:hypothetical protein
MAAAPAVTEAMAGQAVRGRIVGRGRVRKAGNFLRERQQRIAFGAAHTSPRVLAEEEDDESENEAETDRERDGYNRHGETEFNGSSGDGCRLGNLGDTPSRHPVATVPVAEHFTSGKPVLRIATFWTTVFDPEQVGGVLNLRFARMGGWSGRFSFHGGLIS